VRKSPKKGDSAQKAWAVVQEATAGSERPADPKKAVAVESGRRGGLRGGRARAEKMTPEARSEQARRAAEARWARK
jgi:hypothetical protein